MQQFTDEPDSRVTLTQLTELARTRVLDPTIFDEHSPFFWSAEISSNRMDAYFTRMDPRTTPRNYAEDAQAGVAFQNSHNVRSLH